MCGYVFQRKVGANLGTKWTASDGTEREISTHFSVVDV
jgi:hypothetical protein